MPTLSFRAKILLAMMVIVVGVTGVTLFTVQNRVQQGYLNLVSKHFLYGTDWFRKLRESRRARFVQPTDIVTRSVRSQALMRRLNVAREAGGADDEDAETYSERLYRTAEDELRYLLNTDETETEADTAVFFRLIDERFDVIDPPRGIAAGRFRGPDELDIPDILSRVTEHQAKEGLPTLAGYLSWQADRLGKEPRVLLDVLIAPIIDVRTDIYLGALAVGFPASGIPSVEVPQADDAIQEPAVWVDGVIYRDGRRLPERPTWVDSMEALMNAGADRGDFEAVASGLPHRFFFLRLDRGTGFPPAVLINSFSMAQVVEDRKRLRLLIAACGSVALIGALVLSMTLSHGLVVPIRELVGGTNRVRQGDYSVQLALRSKDEVGQLTESFNEMTHGLAMKEKYRGVLEKVADKAIADRLIEDIHRGDLKLGGEALEVSVLFCDIRGFTALSQNMDPQDVISLLNDHFGPLTRVVKQYHGSVDKFVGDLIMAIFGAPAKYEDEDDALNAVRCAMAMIEERETMNRQGREVLMGIGVATGTVVAGNMGSEERIDYTVLGERVNLASRLCGKAGAMEVVIDDRTHAKVESKISAEPLAALTLKGFDSPVPAYRVTRIL